MFYRSLNGIALDDKVRRLLHFYRCLKRMEPQPVWCPWCQRLLGSVIGPYKLRCICGNRAIGFRTGKGLWPTTAR